MNVNQWITLIIAVLAVISITTAVLVTINKKAIKPTCTTQTPGTPAVSAPRKPWFLKLCIVVFIIAVVTGTWWFTNYHTETGTIQPDEEWILVWNLPPNLYSRGRNVDTLEVRIVKNDSDSLYFDMYYTYDGVKEAARAQLNKQGERMVGSWCQDNPRDGGSIYMDKVGDKMWVGQFTGQTGESCSCTLKRK